MVSIIISLLFLFGLIFLFFLIIRKYIKNIKYFKNKIKISNVVSLILSIFLYLALSLSLMRYISGSTKREFDKSTWIRNEKERPKMVYDLLESNFFIGKSINEIEDILGKPKIVKDQQSTYELIGKTWSEFLVYDVKLTYKNDSVTDFSYSIKE